MAKLLLPRSDLKRLIRARRRKGADRLDEVWNGVYVMSPEADNQHQLLAKRLVRALDDAVVGRPEIVVYPTVNVSDRPEEWKRNYRVPDVSVFLPGNPAEDRGSHWLGGPDLAVEILSRQDRSRKKFDFFARVGLRELMLVDRNPWSLELYRWTGEVWELAGKSNLAEPAVLASAVLPVTFRLVPGEQRPQIEVVRTTDGQTWLA